MTTHTRDDILDGLRQALTDILEPDDLAKVDLTSVGPDTRLLSLPVDSLALMEMMTRIEDRFRVFIPEETAFAFTTVGEVVSFVDQRLAAKAAKRS